MSSIPPLVFCSNISTGSPRSHTQSRGLAVSMAMFRWSPVIIFTSTPEFIKRCTVMAVS